MPKSNDFNKWIRTLANTRGWNVNDMLNDPTYDYRLFYNKDRAMANKMLTESKDAHFSDIAKTVEHPTFSNGSYYSGKKSKHNPLGLEGGNWENNGHTYRLSYDQANYDWNVPRTISYLEQFEPNGVKIIYPRGEYPVIDGHPYGGVLPEVVIKPKQRRSLEDKRK